MTRRLLVAVLLALGSGLVIVGDASPADAACAGSPDLVESVTKADTVFVGSVYSVSSHDRVAVMEVIEIWKGPTLQATVGVHGGDPETPAVGPDDRTFEVGRTYLVVPTNESPPFIDSLCTATMLYRPTGEIPKDLWYAVGASEVRYTEAAAAASSAPTAIESLTEFANSPAVWGTPAVALVVGVGVVAYRGSAQRRRKAAKAGTGRRLRINFEGVFNRSGSTRLRKLRSRSK